MTDVWPFPHNWIEDVSETLQFLTDVLASPLGYEQRRALRLSPRRFFETTILVTEEERTFFDLAVMKTGGKPWLIPLWPLGSRLDTPATAGDSTIYLDTTGREFLDGGQALIRLDPFNYAVVDITTVAGSSLALSAPLERSWARGMEVYPLREARLTEQPSTDRRTDNTLTATMRFRVTTQNDLPEDFYSPTVEYYEGYPVLTMKPDERDTLTYSYTRLMEENDSDTGLVEVVDTAGVGFPVQQYRWFLNGVEEHTAFRSFIYALVGRQKAVWLPTFYRDLEVTSAIAADDIAFFVKRCGYAQLGGPATGRQFVRIELIDGSSVYRRIVSATVAGGGTERLVVNEVLPALTLAQIARVSFMTPARLDQDNIDIAHKTDIYGVATCQAAFKLLRTPGVTGGFNRTFNQNFSRSAVERV